MLFIIGIILFIISLCIIIYNKPNDKNAFDAILDAGDKYIDVFTKKHTPISKIPKKYDIPVIKGDKITCDLACPKSLGKGGMKNERRCRKILEKIFKKEFPTVRPNFLKNPATGRNLEIDCYNHELRLGLEYDGKQHTEMTKFHSNTKELLYQVRKDQFKAKECKKLGITLIKVPYWVVPAQLESYIRNKLKEAGFKVDEKYDD